MNKKSFKPADFATLSPYLTVHNVKQAYEFYKNAFGFALRGEPAEHEKQWVHVELAFQDATLMLGQEGAFGNESKAPSTSKVASPISLYIYCEDVDALFDRAVKAGAKAIMPCDNMFWGDRMCRLQDPDGHEWCFATHTGEHHHGHGCC